MSKSEPTNETREFAKEAIRVSGLNRAGLSTDEDFARLERLAEDAQRSQRR